MRVMSTVPSSSPSSGILFYQVFGEVLVLVSRPVPGRIPGFAGEGDRQDTEPDASAGGVRHEVQALLVDTVVGWCWGRAVATAAGIVRLGGRIIAKVDATSDDDFLSHYTEDAGPIDFVTVMRKEALPLGFPVASLSW